MKPSILMFLCRTVERDMQEVWLELEKVYKSGLAKSIGVSNFEPETIDRLLNPAQWEGGLCTACTVVPAVNQVELHPSWPQRRLSRYCHSRGIRMVAYSPLANPSLQQDGVVHPNPMENPVVLEIAKRHGKTGAQVNLHLLVANAFLMCFVPDGPCFGAVHRSGAVDM